MPRQKTKTQVGASFEFAITEYLTKEGNFAYAIQNCIWNGIQKLEEIATLQPLEFVELMEKKTNTTKTTNTFSLDIGVASRINYFAKQRGYKMGTIISHCVRLGFKQLYPDVVVS